MKASRFCTLFCALLVLAGSARALDPAAPDDDAIDLDQTVQALKDEMVLFNRDALAAQNEFLLPRQTRLSVYLSNRIPGLLLEKISVTIDDSSPVTYEYSEIDSHALLDRRALQPLIQTNVDRGAHRIRANFVGQFAEADEGEEPIVGSYEGVIDKGIEPAEVELQILRGVRKATPGMKLKEWRAAAE